MPIASPQTDNELLQLILQSKPHHGVTGSLPQSQLVANFGGDGGACGTSIHIDQGDEDMGQNVESEYFSTHSPPILNLSPNLSPTSEHQRTSPVYDLRESTRRRGLQGNILIVILVTVSE